MPPRASPPRGRCRRADRGVEAAREPQKEREGVLGEVDADVALLARQRHVAVRQLGVEDIVHAGADGMVEAKLRGEREEIGVHAAEEDVRVGQLTALRRLVLGLDEARARARRLEDIRAIGLAQPSHDQIGNEKYFHRNLRPLITLGPSPSPLPRGERGEG